MNLDDMLKEASIIDHSWYQTGLGSNDEAPAEGMDDPTDGMIQELEVEWGTGGPSIDIEDLDVVERNAPEDAPDDDNGVVLFAREQMNRGVMGEELIASLKGRFDETAMAAEKQALGEQLGLQGFVGCVAIDGRGYKSCKEAMALAENSPYKGSIKFVIGCSCGDSMDIPITGEDMILAESTGNSMDDFMASSDKYEPKVIACCPTTRLPIMSAQTDIDKENMAPDVIDLMNVTGLPEGELASIDASDAPWQEKVKKAFRMAYESSKTAKVGQYKGKIDASEYRIQQADNEIELGKEASGQIDLKADVAEMKIDTSEFKAEDIDMGQDLVGIFEGSDEIQVDDFKEAQSQLDVDIRPDMEL